MSRRSRRERIRKFLQLYILPKPRINRKENRRLQSAYVRSLFRKPAPKPGPGPAGSKMDWKTDFNELLYEWKVFLAPLGKSITSVRPRFLIFAVILFFVGLEIVLQVASVAVLFSANVKEPRKVLCIGDRYSKNVPTYPIEIAKLAKNSGRYEVLNHQKIITSAEAARMVDQYLETTQLSYLYLLTGATDLNSDLYEDSKAQNISEHVMDPGKVSFQWKYRTPKLLESFSEEFPDIQFRSVLEPAYTSKTIQPVVPGSITWKKQPGPRQLSPGSAFVGFPTDKILKASLEQQPQTPPAGNWTVNGMSIQFQQNGSVTLPQKQTLEGPIQATYPNRPKSIFWRKINDQIVLSFDFMPGSVPLKKVQGQNFDRFYGLSFGWVAVDQQRFDFARTQFNEAIKLQSQEPMAHAGLATVFWKLGNIAEARKEYAWLIDQYEKDRDQRKAEALFLSMVGEPVEEKARWAEELLSHFPKSPLLWSTLAQYTFEAGRYDISDVAIKMAMELTPELLKFTKGKLLRMQARFLVQRNPQVALQSLTLAYMQDKILFSFRRELFRDLEFYRSAHIDEAFRKLTDLSLSRNEKHTLKRIFETMTSSATSQKLTNLEYNLRHIIEHCKIHGVSVVLLSYPVYWNEANEILAHVAEKTSTKLVDLSTIPLQYESIRASEKSRSVTDRETVVDRLVTESVSKDASQRLRKTE